MPLPQFQNLEPSDILKLNSFMMSLIQGFDRFVEVTLQSLNYIFDYPISTYTIFDDSLDGNRRVVNNYSNYFSKSDLDYYNTIGIKDDIGFQQSSVRWANNSSNYADVTQFSAASANPFELTMLKRGIRYQIRIGAHSRATPPLHVLSVYKPLSAEKLDDYELLLLSSIGQVFSICVSLYKKYDRKQRDAAMYAQMLNASQQGIAFFDPYGNAINCNRAFQMQAAHFKKNQSLHSATIELVSQCEKACMDSIYKDKLSDTVTIGNALITTEQQRFGERHDHMPYYMITISNAPKPSREESSLHRLRVGYGLTAREAEVLQLVVEGLNNTEIMERLVISMPTVKTHIKNIFSKCQVSSRIELLSKIQG